MSMVSSYLSPVQCWIRLLWVKHWRRRKVATGNAKNGVLAFLTKAGVALGGANEIFVVRWLPSMAEVLVNGVSVMVGNDWDFRNEVSDAFADLPAFGSVRELASVLESGLSKAGYKVTGVHYPEAVWDDDMGAWGATRTDLEPEVPGGWIIRKSRVVGCEEEVYCPSRDIVYHAFDEGEAAGLCGLLNEMTAQVSALQSENAALRVDKPDAGVSGRKQTRKR